MHKQITTSASKMTFESKWKLMWIFKQGVNIAVTDVLIVDAVKAIVGAVDVIVVVVVVAAVVVVVAHNKNKNEGVLSKKSFIFNVQCLV